MPHKSKEARAAYNKAYREAHRAESQAYWQAHKAVLAATQKAYRQTRKAERAAYNKAWAQAHPDKRADNHARRRARKRGATVEKVSRAVVFTRDGGRCHLCGKKVNPKQWHLDHINPLACGGKHCYQNVAVSHPTCNQKKHAKAGGQPRLF